MILLQSALMMSLRNAYQYLATKSLNPLFLGQEKAKQTSFFRNLSNGLPNRVAQQMPKVNLSLSAKVPWKTATLRQVKTCFPCTLTIMKTPNCLLEKTFVWAEVKNYMSKTTPTLGICLPY